jgi:hypothetical protein
MQAGSDGIGLPGAQEHTVSGTTYCECHTGCVIAAIFTRHGSSTRAAIFVEVQRPDRNRCDWIADDGMEHCGSVRMIVEGQCAWHCVAFHGTYS